MRSLISFDRQSLRVSWWLLCQMVARKSHLKVLLIFVKTERFAGAVFALSPTRLTDISLLPPFVIVWKGLNCITCKWRDLIFGHYLFIRENEQNISGSPNEGGNGGGGGMEAWETGGDDHFDREEDEAEQRRTGSFALLRCISRNFLGLYKNNPSILGPEARVSLCMRGRDRSGLIIKPMMAETQQLQSYSCDKSEWQAWVRSGIFPGQS